MPNAQTNVGIAAAGAAVVAMAAFAPRAMAISPALTFADIPGTGNIKVLNYALALEDLESNLYSQAYLRMTTGGTNRLGNPVPGLNLSTSAPDVELVREFGDVEREHRNLLRSTLGGSAISRYKYDFGMEAKSRKQILDLIYLAEKTGVGAYLGAIAHFDLSSNLTPAYLQIAGSIQGTEARHTAVFAQLLDEMFDEGLDVAPRSNSNSGIDQPIDPDTVLASISPFIAESY